MSIATEIERLQNAKANIKTAIENKGVTVGDGTIDTYAEKIGQIASGGGLEIERYANLLQLTSLNIFGKSEVVLNLDSATSLQALCSVSGQDNPNRNTTVEHLTINCPNLVTITQMMLNCDNYNADNTLKHLTFNVDTQNVNQSMSTFRNLRALQIIDGQPLNLTNANTSDWFSNTQSLVEVRFVENSIKKSLPISSSAYLSADTIQSIIDGLADLTGSTTQTLTLHADIGAILTDEQKAVITAKNWTLAY